MILFENLKTKGSYSKVLSLENLDFFIPYKTNRHKHILGVINLAKQIEEKISFNGHLVTSALYHDIGYSDKIKHTGFHPVDSALKAYEDGINEEIINAVMSHTGAIGEAYLTDKNLIKYYAFTNENTVLSKFLTYCDTHINSVGTIVSLEERLNDIYARYNKSHHVYKNIKNNSEYFKNIEKYVEEIIEKGRL